MAITLDNLVGMEGGKYTDDTDVLAEWGVSGKTITKGMILGPKGDKAFKSVVVASGSVLLIRG